MSKNKMFQEILGSLSGSESKIVKEAQDNVGDVVDPKPDTQPSGGLADMLSKTATEDVPSVENNEGVDTLFSPEEEEYLAKEAKVIDALYSATGIDLEKVAAEEDGFLEKMAKEILSETEEELQKEAMSLAVGMADAFIERVNNGH